MELNEVITTLHYGNSPNFFAGRALETDRDFGHVFRKAQAECKLQGVYALNGSAYDRSLGNVPVVYVCEADSEAEAREIHRKVWNQNAVPFLLVISRGWIRLYPGFRYDRDIANDPLEGALKIIADFNQTAIQLSSLRAQSIDSGLVWREMETAVTPDMRVDWRLLGNLRELDDWLRAGGVRDRMLAHSMIGKFVYLHYLRQRQILSDARLEQWQINPEHIFGHSAQLNTFLRLVEHVDKWLNGSVFPLSASKIREFGAERLQKVASVFQGQEPSSGQLPLFDIYDFSFIPIETLSVIYEQFLHDTAAPSGKSEGEARGAYYTPVPLVNFVLDRLDSRKRLVPGMRVFDPACGSGVFLVQCYRKLIERQLRESAMTRLRPAELGRLLTDHIFGVDVDNDACQIAELSLSLTLLEYVNPPDLTETKFRLPPLRNRNIFRENVFDDESQWYRLGSKQHFDWIVGNPPWKELKPKALDASDKVAWSWITTKKSECPVGGNQVAEAFAWRSSDVLARNGVTALLLPAMTLSKYESAGFRRSFFHKNELWSVANFANFAEVLFGGRARLPAAVFFYSTSSTMTDEAIDDKYVEVFSPLLANYPAGQAVNKRRRQETWNIVVNSRDLRDLKYREIIDGAALPWKIAMWGSKVDGRVLTKVEKQFKSLGVLEREQILVASQGPEFLSPERARTEPSEKHLELAGKVALNVAELRQRRYLLRFPIEAFRTLTTSDTFLSKRAGIQLKLSVCKPHT
jgi:N-6 DNA Methylase